MSGRLISQQQMDNLRSRSQRYALTKKLLEEFGSNTADLYIMTSQELTRLWLKLKARIQDAESQFETLVGALPNAVVDYTSPLADGVVLARLGRDMHRSGDILGAYRVINREGKSLIVFRGHPGLRRHLTGTVYGINNTKVTRVNLQPTLF